jgi:hypothetical protein
MFCPTPETIYISGEACIARLLLYLPLVSHLFVPTVRSPWGAFLLDILLLPLICVP